MSVGLTRQAKLTDLPEGWSLLRLEDVADILDKKRIPINSKERQKRHGDVPYYGATGQVGWIDDYLFDEELVLLGEDGAPFFDSTKQKSYIIKGKSWVNNHAHVLRTKNGMPSAYLKYYLDIVDYQKYITGTTRAKLNQSSMRQIPVPVAPPEQQQSIVAEIEKQFSRLDEAVTSLKRAKANLKRYKAAVLKAAVEGKLTEEWRKQHPDVEPASELLKRILAERRRKWENMSNVDLPKIASTWEWATFDQVSTRVTVGHVGPMKNEYVEEGIPFLRSQNVRENRYDATGLKYISPEFHQRLSKSAIQPNDIAVVRSGNVGVSCVIPQELIYANCADLVIIKKPKGILPEYGAFYMNSIINTRVASKKVGVALTHFNTKSVSAMPIPVPPLSEQAVIVEEVQKRVSLIVTIETNANKGLARGERIRQSILKQAFAGEMI